MNLIANKAAALLFSFSPRNSSHLHPLQTAAAHHGLRFSLGGRCRSLLGTDFPGRTRAGGIKRAGSEGWKVRPL